MGRGVARGLPEAAADRDPIELFDEWFAAAAESGVMLPEAACLATATPDGRPSARMVLLKGYEQEGFRFYTNYDSRKAEELDANPRVSMCFHWAVLERQVRIEGTACRLTREQSLAYFKTRPRGSRIGAWASKQSQTLGRRAELQQLFKDYEAKFPDDDIPLPPNWGGYRLEPTHIEFWQGRASRLHDRLLFEREDEGGPWVWKTRWLYP